MRYVKSPLGLFGLTFVAVALVAACTSAEKAPATDNTAAAAAAAPPAAEMYSVVAKDGSWTVDISPANIVWRKTKGKADSLVFDFKAPSVDGAVISYQVIKTAPDTHTFAATLSAVPCTDNSKKEFTHMAQVWIDQVAYSGCAVKK